MRLTAATALLSLTALAAQAPVRWRTDFDAAKAAAEKAKKVMLVHFTCSDSGNACAKVQNEVFATPEFQLWANETVILLQLDYPKKAEQAEALQRQNQRWKSDYKVTNLPTILLLDAEGKERARMGYEPGGPGLWTKKADSLLFPIASRDAREWTTDFAVAHAALKKSSKYLMLYFTESDSCRWCIKLQHEVFYTEQVSSWAKEHAVLLELDFPRTFSLTKKLEKQNELERRAWAITGFPTVLFLSNAGSKVGSLGYVEGGPEAWIAAAEKQLGIQPKAEDKPKK